LVFDEQGIIVDYGKMADLELDRFKFAQGADTLEIIELKPGQIVMPGFVDSHTHLVFPQWREAEYVMKIKGMSYEEIARQGGGILNTARKMQQATKDELYEAAAKRLKKVIALGTTAIEIKSGYGLETEAELKMLRVARRLKENFPLTIKTTFLGAHAIPL
jgi:imidazolonepropionase